MLPTCLLLLVLIFLALSAHMVLDAIPAWGQAPSSGRRSFDVVQRDRVINDCGRGVADNLRRGACADQQMRQSARADPATSDLLQ